MIALPNVLKYQLFVRVELCCGMSIFCLLFQIFIEHNYEVLKDFSYPKNTLLLYRTDYKERKTSFINNLVGEKENNALLLVLRT